MNEKQISLAKQRLMNRRFNAYLNAPKKYDGIDFTPPQGVRDAAIRALKKRAEQPPSKRGMTAVGIARARDLSNGITLSPETIKRPEHWGGYLVVPESIEFWQGRSSRLHDRLHYELQSDQSWKISRLSP